MRFPFKIHLYQDENFFPAKEGKEINGSFESGTAVD
jgi:hypothetical protein